MSVTVKISKFTTYFVFEQNVTYRIKHPAIMATLFFTQSSHVQRTTKGIRIRDEIHDLHPCFSEGCTTPPLHDDCGILKEIACQIRINLTKARPLEREDHMSQDAKGSRADGPVQLLTNTGNENETQEVEIKQEMEEIVSGNCGETSSTSCEDGELTEGVLAAKAFAFKLSAMSLDKLIAKKGLSANTIKKFIEEREKPINSRSGNSDITEDDANEEPEGAGDDNSDDGEDAWVTFYAYTCSKCGQKFDKEEEEEYNQHKDTCKQNAKCTECEKTFPSVDKLNAHMARMHSLSQWSCNLCSATFAWKKDLVQHASTVHDDRHYKCEQCDKRFSSEENLKIHAKNHSKVKSFSCPECSKAFVYKTKLKAHMLVHTRRDKSFGCEQCAATFVRKASLVMHVKRAHEAPLVCKTCGVKIRGSVASLRKHMLNVRGEKYKYECDICDKEFETSYELQAHKKSHANSYQCNVCGKVFNWKGSYKQHMERHSDVPKYDCPQCGKGFYTKDSVQKHVKYTHGSDRNYHCDFCGLSFKTVEVLKHHKEIHENKRKYKCKTCGKGFNNPSSLTNHRKIHSRKSMA